MAMDDKGWESDPWDGEQTLAPSDGGTPPPPPPGPPPPIPPAPPGPPRGGPRQGWSSGKIAAVVAVAVLVVGGGVGAAIGLSGGHKSAANTPASTSTTSAASTSTTAASTTGTSGDTGSGGTGSSGSGTTGATTSTAPPTTAAPAAPTLLGAVPFSGCEAVSASDRGIPLATAEVVCSGAGTQAVGADVLFYASMPSAADAQAYVKALDSSATSVDPSCVDITLGTGSALCDFTEGNGWAGLATMYIGSNFTFETNSTTEGDCSLLGYKTTAGTSVLVWNRTGSNVVSGTAYCSESTTSLGLTRLALYTGKLNLKT